MTHVDAKRASIASRLHLCNEDELDVLDVLLARVELGRDRYGALDLTKARDWERDEAEELLDMRVYQSIQVVLVRRARVAAIEGQPLPRHWLAEQP
jgi:hypothetical protein